LRQYKEDVIDSAVKISKKESTSDSSIKSDVEQKESLAGSSKDEEVLLNEEFAKLQLKNIIFLTESNRIFF